MRVGEVLERIFSGRRREGTNHLGPRSQMVMVAKVDQGFSDSHLAMVRLKERERLREKFINPRREHVSRLFGTAVREYWRMGNLEEIEEMAHRDRLSTFREQEEAIEKFKDYLKKLPGVVKYQ